MKKIALLYVILLGSLFANENRLLFYGNCIACHGEVGQKVAPHLSEVKGYYLLKYPEKEEFVSNMAQWLSNPNEENAQDKEAIKKYKLMPYLSIDLETLTKIATYIYDNDEFGVADTL
jgi:cytochrome c551/c552